MLLDVTVDVNAQFGRYETLLLATFYKGHPHEVWIFLNAGSTERLLEDLALLIVAEV